MKRRRLRQQITQLLSGLGTSDQAVARSLTHAGVRGTPQSLNDCAVALYLRVVMGADSRIHGIKVSTQKVKVVTRWWVLPTTVTVRLPRPVRQFVVEFDRHIYPALVRDGVEADVYLTPGIIWDS